MMDPLVVLLLPIAAGWVVLALAAELFPVLMVLVQLSSGVVIWLLALLEEWVQWVAGWPYALIQVPTVPVWVGIPYYMLVWTYHLVRKKMRVHTP
jgi:hypothetical protein